MKAKKEQTKLEVLDELMNKGLAYPSLKHKGLVRLLIAKHQLKKFAKSIPTNAKSKEDVKNLFKHVIKANNHESRKNIEEIIATLYMYLEMENAKDINYGLAKADVHTSVSRAWRHDKENCREYEATKNAIKLYKDEHSAEQSL
ncbi:MAG: hypothetical protein MJ152_01170 [Clostridia bacterium]|nr:hypothetical protein [Clostridia bacterium]